MGFQTSSEAVSISEQSGDIYSKGMAYVMHGNSCLIKGYFDDGLDFLLKGLPLCERTNYMVYICQANQYLGDAYYFLELYEKSKYYYGKALELLNNHGFSPSWRNQVRIRLIQINSILNDRDKDLTKAIEHYKNIKLTLMKGSSANSISNILLSFDETNLSEAEHWIKKAIKINQKSKMMWNLGQDYALYSEILKQKNRKSEAKEKLIEAIDIFNKCGADGWVKKYKKEMAQL